MIKSLACILSSLGLVCYAQILGKAEVTLTKVEGCPEPEKDLFSGTVSRRIVNRTTDAYSASVSFDRWIDDKIGVYVNVAMFMDGGYKPSAYELRDCDFCRFLMRHSERNFKRMLAQAGLEPACPVPPGSYKVDDFVLDLAELPETLMYGDYRVDFTGTSEGDRVFCIRAYGTSRPRDMFAFN